VQLSGPMPNAHVRHLCSELVSIACMNSSRRLHAIAGNLEEIGEWSALVLADAPIRCGTKVRVACERFQLRGLVESCTFEELLGFFVRVRLDPESRWSQQWFTPKHLFALLEQRPAAAGCA